MKRLPTKEEYQELIDKCKWTWTTVNNIKGYEVIGPNENSIFLPAVGYCFNDSSSDVGDCGHYWSSLLKDLDPDLADCLDFDSDGYDCGYCDCCCGLSVRLVSDNEGIDLGLSIKWLPCNEGTNKPEEYGNYYTYDEAVELFNNKRYGK